MLAYCALCRMVCVTACIVLITALVPGAGRAQSRVHEATVVLVFLDARTNRPVRAPQMLIELLED